MRAVFGYCAIVSLIIAAVDVIFQGLEIGIRTHVNCNLASAVDDQFCGLANFRFELNMRQGIKLGLSSAHMPGGILHR